MKNYVGEVEVPYEDATIKFNVYVVAETFQFIQIGENPNKDVPGKLELWKYSRGGSWHWLPDSKGLSRKLNVILGKDFPDYPDYFDIYPQFR